jgi:alcohol dehydrogenase class IV
MSDIFAVSAVKKIFANMREVYTNGANTAARREMATAALEAGIAFSNASVTIVHGMSRPIGALFHIAHGLSNAQLLGVCLKYLKSGAVERLCDLAKAIGVYQSGMSAEAGADAFVKAATDLLHTLNIKTLQECGVPEADFLKNIPKMADDALASGSPGNTRRTPSKDDIMALYKELWGEGGV